MPKWQAFGSSCEWTEIIYSRSECLCCHVSFTVFNRRVLFYIYLPLLASHLLRICVSNSKLCGEFVSFYSPSRRPLYYFFGTKDERHGLFRSSPKPRAQPILYQCAIRQLTLSDGRKLMLNEITVGDYACTCDVKTCRREEHDEQRHAKEYNFKFKYFIFQINFKVTIQKKG